MELCDIKMSMQNKGSVTCVCSVAVVIVCNNNITVDMVYICSIKFYHLLHNLQVSIQVLVCKSVSVRHSCMCSLMLYGSDGPLSNPWQEPVCIELMPVCHVGFKGIGSVASVHRKTIMAVDIKIVHQT